MIHPPATRDSQITEHHRSRTLSHFCTENPDLSSTGQDLDHLALMMALVYLRAINFKKPLLVFLDHLRPSFSPCSLFPSIFFSLPFPSSCQNEQANLFWERYLLLPSCQLPGLPSTCPGIPTHWRSGTTCYSDKKYSFEKLIVLPSHKNIPKPKRVQKPKKKKNPLMN